MNILKEMDSLPEYTSVLLTKLRKVYGIELTNVFVDHRCIRVDSNPLYETTKMDIWALHGALLGESSIWGRLVSVFDVPRIDGGIYANDTVLELSAPKKSHHYTNGLQHIEVVVPSIQTLLDQYPHLVRDLSGFHKSRNADISLHLPGNHEIKFHEQPLREVIRQEKVF